MPKYKYLNFRDYWYGLSTQQRVLLAKLSGTRYSYLYDMARGARRAGPVLMSRLCKVDRMITPRLLRPDLYGKRVFVPRKTSVGPIQPDPQ